MRVCEPAAVVMGEGSPVVEDTASDTAGRVGQLTSNTSSTLLSGSGSM